MMTQGFIKSICRIIDRLLISLHLHIESIGLMPLFHVVVRFLPCCCKKVVEGAGTMVRFWKLHLFCFDFPGTSCLSRFQVS